MSFAQKFFVANLSLADVYIASNGAQSQEREAEETAQVLEHFVDGTSRTKACSSAILEPQLSSVAPDYPNEYWGSSNSPQRQLEKLALIREIVDAMPELEMIRLLYEVFVTRCQGPLGNITHTPTFMEQAEKLCGCLDPAPPEAQVMALSRTISMDALACHLLAVRTSSYRASSACSRSLFNSSCSLSPFIPHHLYMAGPLRL